MGYFGAVLSLRYFPANADGADYSLHAPTVNFFFLASSMGLAVMEGVLYAFAGNMILGMTLGSLAIRVFSAIPGHMCYGYITSRYVAKHYHQVGNYMFSLLTPAILRAALIHGLFDFVL